MAHVQGRPGPGSLEEFLEPAGVAGPAQAQVFQAHAHAQTLSRVHQFAQAPYGGRIVHAATQGAVKPDVQGGPVAAHVGHEAQAEEVEVHGRARPGRVRMSEVECGKGQVVAQKKPGTPQKLDVGKLPRHFLTGNGAAPKGVFHGGTLVDAAKPQHVPDGRKRLGAYGTREDPLKALCALKSMYQAYRYETGECRVQSQIYYRDAILLGQ
jgi:hypothetical protein